MTFPCDIFWACRENAADPVRHLYSPLRHPADTCSPDSRALFLTGPGCRTSLVGLLLRDAGSMVRNDFPTSGSSGQESPSLASGLLSELITLSNGL